MEKKEFPPKSGEQVHPSSGEEVPVTLPSAEGRTFPFNKHMEKTFPFHVNQEGPVPSTSTTVVKPVPLSSSRQPSSSRQRGKCPVEILESYDPDTAESGRVVSLIGSAPSTSAAAVGPVPSTNSGQSSSGPQSMFLLREISDYSDPDTAKKGRAVSLVGSAPSTSFAAVGPVPLASYGQPSSGQQLMLLPREISDSSDTETAGSSSSDDGMPLVPFGRGRRFRQIAVQIQRVPRYFNVMDIRYRVDSSLTSAENELRNYVLHVDHFRELSASLEASVAQRLSDHRIPINENELLRRKWMIQNLKVYYNFVNNWGGFYSMLIDKAKIQKHSLENVKNRLEAMMEGPINFFEADEIYNVIDDLQRRLCFTNWLSGRIRYRSRNMAAVVRKLAVGVRRQ